MGIINLCSKSFIINEDNLSREHTLVRDCFELSAAACPIESGMLILATKNMNMLSIYDFSQKRSTTPKKLLQDNLSIPFATAYTDKELYDHVLQLSEKDVYVLHLIADDQALRASFTTITPTMLAAYNAAKKFATVGDLVMTALDNVNAAISLADPEGYVRYANKACLGILETTDRTLSENSLHTLVTSGKSMLLEVIKYKKSIIDMEYSVKYQGRKYNFINSGYPVSGEDGNFLGAIDIFRSIERTKRLTNSIAGYQAEITFDDIVHRSATMNEAVSLAKLFAKSDETVLILGESGVGKELFAQSIHNYSNRKDGPFIAINCANFVNDLIDSELFGYDSGAFTGASKNGKLGKFMLADGGTIFLDEIGEMPIHLQAKLLRVLETRYVTKLGGHTPVKVDVRIIAATNQELAECIKNGTFRSDLYYRLKVLSLDIPPLRKRTEDISPLIQHFVKKTAARMGHGAPQFSTGAIRLLERYDWPGNIRELENTISRVLFTCTEKTLIKTDAVAHIVMGKPSDLASHSLPEEDTLPVVITKRAPLRITREDFFTTYTHCGANKKKTAESLGISRPTLYKLLKEFSLS